MKTTSELEKRIKPFLPALRYFLSVVTIMCVFIATGSQAHAAMYKLHNKKDSVVGEIKIITSIHDDTLPDIARANGLGYEEIKLVNPRLNTWIPGEGSKVILPEQYVLPQGPRKGIILNIPEMRLYYFPRTAKGEEREVITYPLGVGREGWDTPYETTSIISKIKNPSWYPPKSIRKEHQETGELLPMVVKPGPDNPLGDYAMKLGIPTYMIHGTNKPYGVGMRVSHGCIRLYPEDIKDLFARVKIGTPVTIVNQPYKIGSKNGKIYLEAHPYLKEDADKFAGNLTSVVKMVVHITSARQYTIDWDLAKRVINERKGIPVVIGRFLSVPTDVKTAAAVEKQTDANPKGLIIKLDSGLHRNLEKNLF